MLRSLSSLPRAVWLIGLISLLNDAASEMIYPLIPLYLSSVLLAGPRAMGVIEGIAEATASLLKLFSGVLFDRSRHAKPWIIFGYGLAGLGRPLIALVSHWPMLLLLRFADRVGKGLRTSPRDALLASSAGPERRGLAFGLHRAMDNAGAVVGPVIASLMLGAGLGLKAIFLWTILPALLCLLLALMIREPESFSQPAAKRIDWHLHDMPSGFKRYLLAVGLFTLGNSSNMFLLLRARELGVDQTHIPLLWAAVSAVAMTFSTPLAALSDRWGRIRPLAGGYLAYGLFYLTLGQLHHNGLILFVLFGFYGLFMAATEGVEKAMVADLAPEGRQGTAFGWFNLVTGAMLLPASIVFGWLYQSWQPQVAFLFSGCCALSATILLFTWVRPEIVRMRASRETTAHAEKNNFSTPRRP